MPILDNKKVLNATVSEYEGEKFRSNLEKSCYKLLKEASLNFSHESRKFLLLEGFYPSILYYCPTIVNKKLSRLIERQEGKIRDITYTPDFIIEHNGVIWYVDVKGHPNDTYPLKKKMFLKLLQEKEPKSCFLEPHNIRQIKQCIELIRNYETGIDNEGVNTISPK